MRGNVEMWILSAFSINRALAAKKCGNVTLTLLIPNPIDVTFNLFGTKLTYINFFFIFFAKKFGKTKMFIVSLHRHLKKERNNYEHVANTPRYEHASATLPSRYGHVHDDREMLAYMEGN